MIWRYCRLSGGTFECDQCASSSSLHEEAERSSGNTRNTGEDLDEYQVYSKDELNMVTDKVEFSNLGGDDI